MDCLRTGTGASARGTGTRVEGYARDEHTREPLTYRLNGFQVFIVVVAIWLVGGITGLVPFDWFWRHRWEGVAGALVLALSVSLAVLPGVPAQSDSRAKDFFLGRRRNPRLFAGAWTQKCTCT